MGKLLLLLVPDLNNTWHFSVICLWCYSIWSLTKRTEGMPRRARSSKGPRHKSDPHRNVVLTLTVQSKGQCDVTGIWAGERQTEGQQRRGTHTKLPKDLAGYVHGAAGPRFFWLILGSLMNWTWLPGDLWTPDLCVFSAGPWVRCVFAAADSTSPNERCSNMDTSWGVLSRRFKRVTGIYLVTERVTGCFSWIVFVSW